MVDEWKYSGKLDRDKTPGEKFKKSWLDSLSKNQWSAYIDETVTVILDSKAEVGETGLTKNDFPRECGKYYREGLVEVSGSYSDLDSTVRNLSSADVRIGEIALELNELEIELSREDSIEIDEKGRAVEAVVNKILVHKVDRFDPVELPRKNVAPSEMAVEILSDSTIAEHSEVVLDELGDCVNEGLIHKLDEPQMTTQLWEHQLEALQQWVEKGRRGYVDMATATGKTVLGLAAIAYEYGELHPEDTEEIDQRERDRSLDDDAKVLIVADRGLILEQWKCEFDEHLNIPPERTGGSDTIELDWGEIHFRTTEQLRKNHIEDYDLVVLDEAHHYATGAGWGELLEEFDNDVLALSGSIDEGERKDSRVQAALEEHFEKAYTYPLKRAREEGIIPEFRWNVVYAGFEKKGSLSGVTEECEEGFERYAEEIDLAESNAGSSVSDPDLMTYTDVRNYSNTAEGKDLKDSEEEFRKFVSSLFSRRTSVWNMSPDLDTVSEMASEYADSKKCLVLVRSMGEVEEVKQRITDRIEDGLVENIKGISTTDSKKQRGIIEEFKDTETGVLVGTGSLIGEGVDVPHAEVGINIDDGGGVNNTLLQRMGRVLRNPDGKESSEFYNVVPIPTESESTVPREDGKALIEDAAQYRSLGDRIGRKPGYTESNEEVRDQVASLEESGIEMIERLVEAETGVYSYPSDEVAKDMIEGMLEEPRSHPMILEEFSADRKKVGGEPIKDESTDRDRDRDRDRDSEKDRNNGNGHTGTGAEEGSGIVGSSDGEEMGFASQASEIVEVPEALDITDGGHTQYLLEIVDGEMILREFRESMFKDGEVLSLIDSVGWDELPVPVHMKVSELRKTESEGRDSVLVSVSTIGVDSGSGDGDTSTRTLLRLGEDGIVLQQEKERIIGDGTNTVEIEEVSWSDLPLKGLDIEVTRVDRNEEGELVFDVSEIG